MKRKVFGVILALCLTVGLSVGLLSGCGDSMTIQYDACECSFSNGVCSNCGNFAPTEGLDYEENGSYCYVRGIGSARASTIIIPNYYNGKPVVEIRGDAFSGCSSIRSVVIGDNVSKINCGAFSDCINLQAVSFGDNVKMVFDDAFYGCNSLRYNVKDGVKYLGDAENPYFMLMGVQSTGITSVNIDKSCKIIYSRAFLNCSALESVDIHEGITSIGDAAFLNCASLKTVIIPDGVYYVGTLAFDENTSVFLNQKKIGGWWSTSWTDSNNVYWKGNWKLSDGVPMPK
ncbi:MAG: leucine-rich repeat domain-containing protein [Clostridiales bacterium]|nr:leucine-rich repeat domain-containing protein [Clostridiales bacterium]